MSAPSTFSSFNPRSRTGSDHPFGYPGSRRSTFNPRSRTGSDIHAWLVFPPFDLSIHAPARGAISVRVQVPWAKDFQSTLPHGERLKIIQRLGKERSLSIHAPARGAIGSLPSIFRLSSFFQSTLPHGERFWGWSVIRLDRFFQSTLPHGERSGKTTWAIETLKLSIHAPARGAISSFYLSFMCIVSFNPRSRTGSDLGQHRMFPVSLFFQSTLPHGERCGVNEYSKPLFSLSIHAPARGAIYLGSL